MRRTDKFENIVTQLLTILKMYRYVRTPDNRRWGIRRHVEKQKTVPHTFYKLQCMERAEMWNQKVNQFNVSHILER